MNISVVSPLDEQTLMGPLHNINAMDADARATTPRLLQGDLEAIHSKYKISDDVKIPKIIMQTWKDYDIPYKWRESPQSIKDHMPGWTHVLMTDADNDKFCQTHFPDFWPYFKNFKHGIQRADAIRYMWLYVYGGLYMDLDIVIVKPLDDLFYEDVNLYLCASGNVGSFLTNSFMASKPRCKLWLNMIEHMKKDAPAWAWGKHMNVMNTTGPIALNYVVKNYGYSYLALPAKMVMPCSVCNIDTCDIGSSYLRPLVGSSWVTWDTKLMNFGMCNWKPIIILIVLLIILLLVYLIFKHKKYI
jgi:mannosyltransferase OCH1-like enzyme